VVAAGAWTPLLVRSLDLRIPLEPAKGYHLDFHRGAPILRMPLIFHELVLAATPMDGFLRIVGSMEFRGLEPALERARALRLLDAARLYLHGLDQAKPPVAWAGLRPCMPDGLPIIGRSRSVRELVYATGHGMLGLTLAPITGLAVADIVAEGRSSLPLERLSPIRFGA
jgi:D-amino-acid dehydrogenase